MASPDIVFRILTTNSKETKIVKAKSLKALLYDLNNFDFSLDRIIYTNKRGTMITRFYYKNKIKKEVRIYPEKRTGKNEHGKL
tara:strand:+ start:13804 stop:14052 length:249 start_codon:yes stop_codon:yes gene_type:complete